MMRVILPLLLFICTPLLAEGGAAALEGQTYNYSSQFMSMLLTLGFVMVLIFASVWLLKKIMRSRIQTLNRSNGIKVLERRPLNPKASLYLVDILGKGVVIAESTAGIHVVTEFPKETNIEELYEAHLDAQKPAAQFTLPLANVLKKFAKKNA